MKGRLTIKKIKELDILSGIAIIMVVLIHADRFYVRTVLNLDSYLNAGIGVNILDNLIWLLCLFSSLYLATNII